MNNTENKEKRTVEEITAELIKRDETTVKADPQKRRSIIKNMLILFLAAMLLLTFFSNTIMNKSLAEITTESVNAGKLTERVRGGAAAEANQSYNVMFNENRTVEAVGIRAGQEVKEGDVLFTVGTGESAELGEAESALSALELEYRKMLLTPGADYSAEEQAIKNAREDYEEASERYNEAVKAEKASKTEREQYNRNKADLAAALDKEAELTAAISGLDSDDISMIPVEYLGRLYELHTAMMSADSDKSAKKDYENEKRNVLKKLTEQLKRVNAETDSLTSKINTYESSIGEGTAGPADLELDMKTKKRALEDLEIALEKLKKENAVSKEISMLDIEEKEAEIENQKKKIEKLKKDCEAIEIKSEYSGTVSAVNVKPGDLIVPESPLAVIDISDEGYTVKISVDGEVAKKVKSGTEADVVNNWSGDVKAVLREITADVSGGSDKRLLVFDVTGKIESGDYTELSIPCGKGNYDAIVPKSAIYEDSNGKFVLTVKSKSSPLGNRYYAERVNVEVLASDESYSAVTGEINSGNFVIAAANKPVNPGDQVRMKD